MQFGWVLEKNSNKCFTSVRYSGCPTLHAITVVIYCCNIISDTLYYSVTANINISLQQHCSPEATSGGLWHLWGKGERTHLLHALHAPAELVRLKKRWTVASCVSKQTYGGHTTSKHQSTTVAEMKSWLLHCLTLPMFHYLNTPQRCHPTADSQLWESSGRTEYFRHDKRQLVNPHWGEKHQQTRYQKHTLIFTEMTKTDLDLQQHIVCRSSGSWFLSAIE